MLYAMQKIFKNNKHDITWSIALKQRNSWFHLTGKRLTKIVIGILLFFTTNVIGADPVQFADNELKKAIEYRLKITDPTPQDMLNLESLNLNNRQIRNFEGIQYAENLTFVLISYNRRIEDISALTLLPNLKKLVIHDCQISDISFISTLKKLEELDLSGNQITNIAALSSLTRLKKLDLSNNHISDISALKSLTELEYLSLRNNNITDNSALSSLPRSCRINLKNNPILFNRFLVVLIVVIFIFFAGIITLILHDQKKPNRISALATLSLICNIVALIIIIFTFYLHDSSRSLEKKIAGYALAIHVILLILGELLGIISLVKIRSSNGNLKGKWRAWLGVLIPPLTVLWFLVAKLLNDWAGSMSA